MKLKRRRVVGSAKRRRIKVEKSPNGIVHVNLIYYENISCNIVKLALYVMCKCCRSGRLHQGRKSHTKHSLSLYMFSRHLLP